MAITVPIRRLTVDEVPQDQRSWVQPAIVTPLNRALDPLDAILHNGLSVQSNLNAQVVELKFRAPTGTDWSAQRFDVASKLSGACIGLWPVLCFAQDSASHDAAPTGGLSLPAWREVIADGKRLIRLVYQPGLTAGTSYRVRWMAFGE